MEFATHKGLLCGSIHSVEGFLAKKRSRQLSLSSCGMVFFSWCDNCTALRASRRFHMNYSAAHWYRMWPALLSTKMHQSTTIRRAAARNITWCTTQCLVVTQKQKQETITSFNISLGGCPFLVVTQTKTKRCHTSLIRRYQTSGAQ